MVLMVRLVTDFVQVTLGDCGFVSDISAITQHRDGQSIILDSIYPPVSNPFEIYSVKFFLSLINGNYFKSFYQIVDDMLPSKHISGISYTWSNATWSNGHLVERVLT